MTAFQTLLGEVTAGGRFGHREHVHLTWLLVRRYGVPDATTLMSQGLRRTARYAGAPQKYNETLSRAWVELVGHHTEASPDESDFGAFAERNPALFDKRLIARFYTPVTLASARARASWVPPDRSPFPWQ
ncbi:MAG TPA: hypothetical protein VH969_16625 [Actinophytocola sp.]|uniref:hypothetical protein n=1 Tax=Actinophytocola sp. TaxID=1872138 RepID=UPI002F95685E